MTLSSGLSDPLIRTVMAADNIDRQNSRPCSGAGGVCYFFVIIVIRHKTTAAAGWALLLIVRTLFNDAITVAVWTGFHVCLSVSTVASLIRQPT